MQQYTASVTKIKLFLQYFCYIEYLFFAVLGIKIEYPLRNVTPFGL